MLSMINSRNYLIDSREVKLSIGDMYTKILMENFFRSVMDKKVIMMIRIKMTYR
jgi:hypothetical protein